MNTKPEIFGKTDYAILINEHGEMTKFIWFRDKTLLVENGKEVLIQRFEPAPGKTPGKMHGEWKSALWMSREDARRWWKNLVVSGGYKRMKDAIEYFTDLAAGGTGGHQA